MKNFLATLLIISSLTQYLIAAEETKEQLPSNQRVREIFRFFLKQANDQKTDISKKLSEVRREKRTGFCQESCVIPMIIKSSHLQHILLKSDEYIGKDRGERKPDPGYETYRVLIGVDSQNVVYGGRITDTASILFICDLQVDEYQGNNPKIDCKLQEQDQKKS